MRIDSRNRTLAWALLAALAISFIPAVGATAAPRGDRAETVISPWSSLWSTLQDWLSLPGPGEPAATDGSEEHETDDGPDMDPDG